MGPFIDAWGGCSIGRHRDHVASSVRLRIKVEGDVIPSTRTIAVSQYYGLKVRAPPSPSRRGDQGDFIFERARARRSSPYAYLTAIEKQRRARAHALSPSTRPWSWTDVDGMF